MNQLYFGKLLREDNHEFRVTLVTEQSEGSDDYINGIEKTRHFDTEEEALTCFNALRPIVLASPYSALKKFNRHGKPPVHLPLSQCVGPTKRIRHGVVSPGGSVSYWYAIVVTLPSGEKLVRDDNNTGLKFHNTLGALATAHYKEVHPTRKKGRGWDECETHVSGEWVKMAVMREIRA